jgi:hypothetical protein
MKRTFLDAGVLILAARGDSTDSDLGCWAGGAIARFRMGRDRL